MNPTTCDHRIFWWDRDHRVDVVGHQVPFLDLRFLLRREPAEHLTQVLAKLQIQCLPPALRDKDDVVFAVPYRVA